MRAPAPPRKAAQEVEIDHLLAEEFCCDPGFGARFLAACGLVAEGFQVNAAHPEPSLGGDGFGDLLVEGTAGVLRVALLVEDKITAGPALRQAERYAAYAARLREQGWDQVWTVLVAPAGYGGERDLYDAQLDLQAVAGLMRAADPVRLRWRQGIVARAVEKRGSQGVQVPDHALQALKKAYLAFATDWCLQAGVPLTLPELRPAYYDGDSWVERIRHRDLPANVQLRHRLWTSLREACGQVDLIASPAEESERELLAQIAPEGAVVSPFSSGRGVKVSLPVPEMRQASGFDAATAEAALRIMQDLAARYLSARGRQT